MATRDDVFFWLGQFRDHALFLFLLLDDQRVPQLKWTAYDLYMHWSFDEVWLRKFSDLQMRILKLIDQDINVILSPADFESLVEHMLKEFIFYLQLIAGQMTPEDEINFWTQENAEHTELAGHLLPPGRLKNQTLQLSQQLKTAPRDQLLPLIQTSNMSALQLDKLIRAGQVRTVLDPMMLEHEIKEAQRGEQRLRILL